MDFAYKTGLHLFVHNQSTMPFALNSGVTIHPGFETYVGINRKFMKKLAKPYSTCITDLSNPPNDYAQVLFGFFKDLNVPYYDQNFCFRLCFQDKLINNCSCLDISTPVIRNSSYCESFYQIDCLQNFIKFYSQADLNQICNNACLTQCQSIQYDLSLSTAAFPTLSYLKKVQSFNEFKFPLYVSDLELIEFAHLGYLKVIVNYENLYYTLFDESPAITSDMIFGNLGGQLGLFIGISCLSFIELLELVIIIVDLILKRKKKHNKVDSSNTTVPQRRWTVYQ